MIRNILIAVLGLAVIGTSVWGINESREKASLAIQHENNYQRAFHQLTYHIDQLEDKVGTTLAMNSGEKVSGSLADVWRITSMAQNDLGQLPLGLAPLNKTEELLHQIGDFSYKTAIRDLDDSPLEDDEYEYLNGIYDKASDIKHELRKLQAKTLKEGLQWSDAEEAMVAQNEPMDNSIVNGFHMIDNKVQGFEEAGQDWGPEQEFGTNYNERLAEKVKGKEMGKEEAAKKAKEFLGIEEDMDVQVEELGEGVEYEGYSIKIEDPDDGEAVINMDMTKKGGHPVWFLQSRPIDEPNISLNEAVNKAKEFLDRNDFKNMELEDSKQYDSVGVLQFVPVQNDARLYTDAVIVEVALDDGEIAGYKGVNYLANHKERDNENLEPELTNEEAKDEINPNVEIMEEDHLAVIENEEQEEVLCYEFYGTLEDNTYRILINAKTGEEEMVNKMTNAEVVYDTV